MVLVVFPDECRINPTDPAKGLKAEYSIGVPVIIFYVSMRTNAIPCLFIQFVNFYPTARKDASSRFGLAPTTVFDLIPLFFYNRSFNEANCTMSDTIPFIPALPDTFTNRPILVGATPVNVHFHNENGEHAMEQPIENWAEELAKGNQAAFTAIYNKYVYSLLEFARRLLDSRETAEDLCADVFTRLWEYRERFVLIENIEAFLFVSIRNACLNYLRSAQTKIERNAAQIEQLEKITQPDDIVDVRMEYKDRIRKEIEQLPEQCQRIFKLAWYEGLKNKEIANRLRINIKTVSNQKVRALQLLRMSLHLLQVTIALFSYLLPH